MQRAVSPGFADPVLHAQSTFRILLEVLSRPGTIRRVPDAPEPPPGLGSAGAAVVLALIDFETPVWLDSALGADDRLVNWLKFHTGAPLTADPAAAAFALISRPELMPSRAEFAMGSAEYPDRSTTVLLAVDDLDDRSGVILSGPGIKNSRRFDARPLPPGFWSEAQAIHDGFPRGNEVFFCAGERVAALSRSTLISLKEE